MITLNGDSGITAPTYGGTVASEYHVPVTAFKNRIINGAMGISQRGTSFSSPSSGSYTLDRWATAWSGAAPASVAQVAGPTGFRNALQITGAASNTSAYIIQRIESYNCSDLSGTTVTIQANIAVSSAQTIGWNLLYANTQDNFSGVTLIASGTWSATTTATTFTATITNLPAGAANGLSLFIGANNFGAFTSGTVTVTGVQLEKGSTATSFDYRPYGTELQLCQRYAYVTQDSCSNTGAATSTTAAQQRFTMPVSMRASPSATLNTSGSFTITNDFSADYNATSVGVSSYTASPLMCRVLLTGFTGLTAGAMYASVQYGGSAKLLFSAEL